MVTITNVPAWTVRFETDASNGASLTAVTVSVNAVLVAATPSLTVMVMVALPFSFSIPPLLAPGAPPETLRALHADSAKRRDWRYVLGLGVLLDAAYALSGRWDAWREVSEINLVRSDLQQTGPHYKAIATSRVGSPAAD